MSRWKILLILLVAAAAPLLSAEKKPVILAEHFEARGDMVFYTGKVELITELYRIFADFIEYNTKTKQIVAEGRVTITSKDMTVSGGQFHFNIQSMTGEMYDVQGMMEPSVSYTADRLVQVDKEVQKFTRMRFTSCTQLVPRWLISCRKGKIRKDKYIEMKGALLKIKKIPVLYIPYLRYPIADGKTTGFLFPVLGNSDRYGFFMKNSFFWNIKPNLDLKISYDHITKIGKGAELDLRYLFRHSEGSIKFYYFDYSEAYKDTLEEGTEPDDRDWNLNLNHRQDIGFLNTTVRADVNYQSNPEFQSAFNKDYGRFNRSRFNSQISVDSKVKNLTLSVSASRNETFYLQKNTSNVITMFPSVRVGLKQQKLWKIPGYFTLNGTFESIKRSGIDYEEEDLFISDVQSDRFTFMPSYTLNILKLPWLTITGDLKSKQSYYLKSQDPETGEVLDEPLHLSYNTAELTLNGPTFYKIYETSSSRIKHSLEPEIKLSLSSKVADSEREKVIPVDRADYPVSSFVSFSLNSRLYRKSRRTGGSPREFFTYTLSQKFYFDPEIANRGRTIDTGEELISPEYSELTNSFRYKPSKDLSLDLTLAYNHYLKKFQRANLTLRYSNTESPVSGRITYTKYFNPFLAKTFFLNTELIRGDIRMDIPSFPLKVDAAVDYDFFNKRFRYGAVIASYDYQCITFTAEMKIYTLTDGSTDLQYTLGVNFGNLGMVKDFFGSGDR